MSAPFEVLAPSPGVPRTPLLAHIPHASVELPADVRAELLLSDDELAAELLRLTDRHTDELFAGLRDLGATTFVNRRSRLVFDPERFLDDATETAAAIGQGVVYWRTTDGRPLRKVDAGLRARRVKALYRPYHAALDALVTELLAEFGSCLMIDCHSFPTVPMPTETPDAGSDRPDICIGTDQLHTPPELAAGLESAFGAAGFEVARDQPFRGTFVPSGSYGREPRVRSVMIEVRRGTYMDEATGARAASFASVAEAIRSAVSMVAPG